MPVLSGFYGIVIRMYFQQSEHNPPHIHAFYGEDVAAVAILNGEVLEGCLPVKVIALVREWIEKNKTELLHMWETQEFKMLAPLE